MDWKRICNRLLFPPVWLLAALIGISVLLLAAVFLNSWEQRIFAYLVYALAFYTLCVATLFCIKFLPQKYNRIKQAFRVHPLGNRYLTDRAFRSKISLYFSLSISLLYVAVNLWSWHFSRSWWFVVLAVYYGIMAVMRFLLVRSVRKNGIGLHILEEWKRSRLCACILLLINLSLSGAVLMILYQHRGYDYPGIMIYVMALYTFYSTAHAIVEILRYRALESPLLSTSKIVSLSAALVSMLNLETAMFAQFGAEMAQQDQNLMIILTGAGISITVVTLSVILITKATKEIRRNNHGK